jgi:hypothetical protein
MFFAPRHVFSCAEGVRSLFHVWRSRTHFRRYRGRRVPFSCLALPDSFSAITMASGPFSCFARPTHFRRSRASGPVFMYCAPGLVFGDTDGVGTRFHVSHPNLFLAVLRASDSFFMFCAPGLIFGGTEGVRSRFLIFRSRTCFWGYRGRQVPFSCFALPDSLSAVPSASVPFFIFSCFPLPDMFLGVPWALCAIFMFCAPGLVFGGTEGVGSRFNFLRSPTRFRRYRGRRVPF